MREVPVGIAVRCNPLVDLEDRDLVPLERARQLGEHRPRRVTARDGEGEAAARRDRRCGGRGHHVRPAPRDGRGVREHLDLEGHGYAFFSSWPPNCLRIAERSRFAKSSAPREAKRE